MKASFALLKLRVDNCMLRNNYNSLEDDQIKIELKI